jgi:hypothetical protein
MASSVATSAGSAAGVAVVAGWFELFTLDGCCVVVEGCVRGADCARTRAAAPAWQAMKTRHALMASEPERAVKLFIRFS